MAYSETGQNRYDKFAESWHKELPANEAYELDMFHFALAQDRNSAEESDASGHTMAAEQEQNSDA